MHNLNCIKCKSERSVYRLKSTEEYVCKNCNTRYFISTRKKDTFPEPEVQKLLSDADRYRANKAYHSDLTMQERENTRDTMLGKLLKFRHGNGHLEDREDVIYFVGRVKTDDKKAKRIEIKTDMSIEEYKLYLVSDPERDKTLYLTPHPPYNLFVSFMRAKTPVERKHIVEVGVDVNFPIVVGAVKVDDNEPFFVELPFPDNKIRKLQKRENKARSEGNLSKQSMLKSLASRITKGTYYRFIERVHREAKKKLSLKTSKTVKYIWHIEDPKILRNLHSQFSKQGWRPTVLMLCLKEKQKGQYIEIMGEYPAYTSISCNKCGEINVRGGDLLKCKCGEVIDWHRNASLNLLNGIKKDVKPSQSSTAGALVTSGTKKLDDFLQLHDKLSLPLLRQ